MGKLDKFRMIESHFMILTTVIVLIIYASILWKKKHFQQGVNSRQQNLLNLNQTVAIRVWLAIEIFSIKIIRWFLPQEKVLVFEMIKIIIVDNICYRFLAPLLLLLNTKKEFTELWSNSPVKRTGFYLSEQIKLPRRQTTTPRIRQENEFNREYGTKFIYVKSKHSFIKAT